MRKFLLALPLLMAIVVFSGNAVARVSVQVNIGIPPVVFMHPPMMVVIPGTYVYVIPDSDIDIYFYDGWWWRPWHGQWYRSHSYEGGWIRCRFVPRFYHSIPLHWRAEYASRRWHGNRWEYRAVPSHQVEQNWGRWKKEKYWEKQQQQKPQNNNGKVKRGRGNDQGSSSGRGDDNGPVRGRRY